MCCKVLGGAEVMHYNQRGVPQFQARLKCKRDLKRAALKMPGAAR